MEVVRRYLESSTEITSSPAEAVVRFRTAKREEELAGLLAALVNAGVGVTQFREVQTDLEEAFMTVSRTEDQIPGREQDPRHIHSPAAGRAS